MSENFSAYDDADHINRTIAQGNHREVIGGMWEELGDLQASFLIESGLQPGHRLIDVGCGSLRGGVPLTRYLNSGCYYGIDLSDELLRAGYEREIKPAGLAEKLPSANLHATGDFALAGFGVAFDFGIAQSVFTHMPIRRLTDCLHAIAPYFVEGGRFYVTYFERPENATDVEPVLHQPGGITTYPDRDPYDNRLDALEAACPDDWALTIMGDWQHPRDQQMALFTRRSA